MSDGTRTGGAPGDDARTTATGLDGRQDAKVDVTPGGDVAATPTPEEERRTSLFSPEKPLEVVEVRTGMFGVHGSGDTSGYGGLTRQVTMPRSSPRPYGGWYDDAVDVLAEVLDEAGVAFDAAVESVLVDPPAGTSSTTELTLHVRREHLVEVCRALRDDQDLRFELSLGVSGVHYPHDEGRELHAVYHLTSVTHGRSLRLEVSVPDADPHIPSTTTVYPTNDWHERETWDFFGIVFDGHPALARIEMPDDWPGHPQRKDYPLGGIPVEYKGATVPPADQRRSYS